MKISIIIPVYNKEKYLAVILDQIIHQTMTDFECLLIDDGSTDSSGEICDTFALRDRRLQVFHIPNGGVSHARNIGLDNAAGEYITFIDADDEIAPEYLENLYTCITESKADLVISGCQKFWDNRPETVAIIHPLHKGTVSMQTVLESFGLVQKETGLFGYCVIKIRFDEHLRLAEDFEFNLKLYANVRHIYFDDHCLYHYRQEAENSSALVNDREIDYFSQLQINLRYRDFMRNADAYVGKNKSIIEQLLSNYIYFSVFYCPENIMNVRFPELVRLQKENEIVFVSGNFLQRAVLFLLGNGHWTSVKFLILVYRTLRKAIKHGLW